MPAQYTYPGVYVEEIPSGVHPIAGVSTSETAFVDFFARGPMNDPKRVTSFEEFERLFGGLHSLSEASYAIQQYFTNGGGAAWIVRVMAATAAQGGDPAGPAAATITLKAGSADVLKVDAANPGVWGEGVQVGVKHESGDAFTLVVREVVRTGSASIVGATETYSKISLSADALKRINEFSALVRVTDVRTGTSPPARPDATAKSGPSNTPPAPDPVDPSVIADPAAVTAANDDWGAFVALDKGADGAVPGQTELISGVNSLDKVLPFIFNILCLPRAARLGGARTATYDAAAQICKRKRAFLIVDPAPGTTKANAAAQLPQVSENAALYHPRLKVRDPLREGLPVDGGVGASGAVAGVYARTDTERGVWKAPAGTDAGLFGIALEEQMTDQENGQLNVQGVNVLRSFPIYGNVVWGARTTKGADAAADEWKYVPVRRTALYIEESLYQGLKWVVFEPNDEPLWSQIRLNVGSFMHSLFRQGAFAGGSPRDAYFVKCDKDTTTQADVDRGIVNIVVGFKPLKPAEFVVLRIQQIAGQIET